MTLREHLQGFAIRALGLEDLHPRLELVEEDLDCDQPGSLAGKLHELRAEVRHQRALMEEWVDLRADQARGVGEGDR